MICWTNVFVQNILKSFDAPFPVIVSGCTAGTVNGVYKPTKEVCDGKVAYQKEDDVDRWIEYNQSFKMWMARSTVNRNSNRSHARSSVTNEEILSGKVNGWEEEKNGNYVASLMVYYNCTVYFTLKLFSFNSQIKWKYLMLL